MMTVKSVNQLFVQPEEVHSSTYGSSTENNLDEFLYLGKRGEVEYKPRSNQVVAV